MTWYRGLAPTPIDDRTLQWVLWQRHPKGPRWGIILPNREIHWKDGTISTVYPWNPEWLWAWCSIPEFPEETSALMQIVTNAESILSELRDNAPEKKAAAAHAELTAAYPDASIIVAPDFSEVIAEIKPGKAVVALITRSKPHFHDRTHEIYAALKGTAVLVRQGQGLFVTSTNHHAIPCGAIHHMIALEQPTWICVTSDPPWSKNDHYIVELA